MIEPRKTFSALYLSIISKFLLKAFNQKSCKNKQQKFLPVCFSKNSNLIIVKAFPELSNRTSFSPQILIISCVETYLQFKCWIFFPPSNLSFQFDVVLPGQLNPLFLSSGIGVMKLPKITPEHRCSVIIKPFLPVSVFTAS